MAGATLMTKHLVTIDEDKDRKKKSGVTALSSQTKAAKSCCNVIKIILP